MPENPVSPPCIVCGACENRLAFISHNTHGRSMIDAGENFDVYSCGACDALYIGNIPVDRRYYERYYGKGYYETPASSFGLKMLSRALSLISFSRKTALMRRFIKRTPARILDVGCGTGVFLESLNPDLFQRNGVEINPEGYKECLEKGISVHNQPLRQIDFGSSEFDIVTFFHVLEHLEQPVQTLAHAAAILSEGGIVILSVPNRRSIGCRVGGPNWFHLDSPRHLFIPSVRTIQRLAADTGLEIVEQKNEFCEYPMDLFWSLRNSPLKYLAYPFYPFFKAADKETMTLVMRQKAG